MTVTRALATSAFVLAIATPACAQSSNNPFPTPIRATDGAIVVGIVDFAVIPDVGGQPARPMIMFDEPGSSRMFVNDMRGPIFSVSYDGRTVTQYVDTNDPRWGHNINARGRENGMQSFAFHPQFNQPGTPGYGKFYTWVDVTNTDPAPDFASGGGDDSHDTLLLEWTATTPGAATYDGGPPRVLFRVEQPYSNHNGGQVGFNPLADPGDPDFGMLYVGLADGGSGGDPMNLAQNLSSPFGKVLRIDPLGTNSANGNYGIPADNPFIAQPAGALGEIWALGVRNPQRFAWDPINGNMYLSDIGQNTVEELSPVSRGANLGWHVWEGSFLFRGGRAGVGIDNQRADPAMTYPIAEYDHDDPVLIGRAAVTGVHVYRAEEIPQLRGRILFGDNPSGEVFHVSADDPPAGGQNPIGRVLFSRGGQTSRLLDLIQAKNREQGRDPASRADLRFGSGPRGQVFLLNKADGTIRRLVAPGG